MVSSVDYTFKKRSILRDLRYGRISGYDACDAHPEIRRIARLSGIETERDCPICDKRTVRDLHFVYGEELGHQSGRIFEVEAIWRRLPLEYSAFTCYVVEVCTDCGWNHLVRSHHFQQDGGAEQEVRLS